MAGWRYGLAVVAFLVLAGGASAGEPLTWSAWSAEALAQAKRENRFVILDLEAVWCHWCHVMEKTTYSDAKVVDLIKSKYVAVRVDQDANPDLSARYGDWGWPATIIFAPDGTEIVKRRGYIEPQDMVSLLQAVIDDPAPGPSAIAQDEITPAATSALSKDARTKLVAAFNETYDGKYGGWGDVHKFIDADSMDYVLAGAEHGDKQARRMAETALNSALSLMDPVAGGIYQYSDAADWKSPHYEKIMWYQANGLRQYASAYGLFKNEKYLAGAKDIYRYMTAVLMSQDGTFFATQDADADAAMSGKDYYKLDASARQKRGRQPHVDAHIYARENGWAISALAAYANATGEAEPIAQAERAADWIVAHRRSADGVFRHSEQDRGGPFLGDTIAMGVAALDLYSSTGKRKWLDLAREAGAALQSFRVADGGFAAAKAAEGPDGALAKPYRNLDEQVQAARFAIRLWRTLGDLAAKDLSDHAMQYLVSETVLESGRVMPGVLVASSELSHEPTHITVVGHKDDIEAQKLHAAARRYPSMNKRVDWWDPREGAMANPDVIYPELDRAAAFACSDRICSLPAFSAGELTDVVAQMLRRPGEATAR